jgi:hypothetical protein
MRGRLTGCVRFDTLVAFGETLKMGLCALHAGLRALHLGPSARPCGLCRLRRSLSVG